MSKANDVSLKVVINNQTTKRAGKLTTISQLYNDLDDVFKAELEGNCLFKLLKLPSSHHLSPLLGVLLKFYDSQQHVFNFGAHQLGITLEDILYLTGLPIRGKPVICSDSRDIMAFTWVFGLSGEKRVSLKKLKEIAVDQNQDLRRRKIGVLLILISCFITPSHDGQQICATYIQFVENLDDVDSYAWGAALLAFLYSGMEKWASGVKSYIDGNLWIVLSFVLFRIPKLWDAIGLELLALEDYRVPLLGCVVDKVKMICHNHKPKYLGKVDDILLNLSDEDIVWTPYDPLLLDLPLRDQVQYGTLLAPLFCNNYVVYHRPHFVAKQFSVFDGYCVSKMKWKDVEIKKKQNKGPAAQNLLQFFKKELLAWDKGELAQNLMPPVVEISHSTTPETPPSLFSTPPPPPSPPQSPLRSTSTTVTTWFTPPSTHSTPTTTTTTTTTSTPTTNPNTIETPIYYDDGDRKPHCTCM